ncbi:unnamed protein product [Chrysoparadoxa australica]
MSWCLYFLAANKRIQTKLQAEVDKVLGDDSVPTTHEQVEALSYTMAIVQEVMRLRSPASFTVMSNKVEHTIAGRTYPPGCDFYLMTHLGGTRESNFTRADEFIPERWIKSEREALLGAGCTHKSEALVSFGGGARACPGKDMAMLESVCAVASIAKAFTLSLTANHGVPGNEFCSYGPHHELGSQPLLRWPQLPLCRCLLVLLGSSSYPLHQPMLNTNASNSLAGLRSHSTAAHSRIRHGAGQHAKPRSLEG